MPFTTPGKLWENGIFFSHCLEKFGNFKTKEEVSDKNGRPNDG